MENKNVLTFSEFCTYTGFKPSYAYKLTSLGKVPHYKPLKKCIFFDRLEVEAWLLQNKATSFEEIEQKAISYVASQKGGATL